MTALQIRSATYGDADSICRVHLSSIREICSRDYSPVQIHSWSQGPRPESYQAAMKNGERMFVAVDNDEIVGFAGCVADEIRAVYVHAGHVGKGVGVLLLFRVEQQTLTETVIRWRI